MEREAVKILTDKAKKSEAIINDRPLEYIVRAMMAGAFIGFAIIFCLKTVNGLYMIGSPVTGLIAAFLFGVALVMIVQGGAELFTGNTMYFTFATLRGEISFGQTLKVWVLCLAGNALGGILFAFILAPTGILRELGMDNWLFTLVEGKMALTTGEIFFRAILCNWMVCMAIFLPKTMKSEGAQLFTMILLVAVFFVSGYEHVIANFAAFALALITPHPDTITLAGAIHNLIPATLGNIVGGTLFMGFLYTWLTTKKTKPEKVKKKLHIKQIV